MSSSGASSSGTIPRSSSVLRTVRLLARCSLVIAVSPFSLFVLTLCVVIAVANCLPTTTTSGAKSASARLDGTFHFAFIASVSLPPNSTASPLPDARDAGAIDVVLVEDALELRLGLCELLARLKSRGLGEPVFDEFQRAGRHGEVVLREGDLGLARIAVHGDEI